MVNLKKKERIQASCALTSSDQQHEKLEGDFIVCKSTVPRKKRNIELTCAASAGQVRMHAASLRRKERLNYQHVQCKEQAAVV